MHHRFVPSPDWSRIRPRSWPLGAIVTIFVLVCHMNVSCPAEAGMAPPGGEATEFLPTSVLIVVLMDALLKALDGAPEPEWTMAAAGTADPSEAAEVLIDAYAAFGVDPGLAVPEAQAAIDDAVLAEMTLVLEDIGLDEALEQELIQTLGSMRADLEGLIGGS